MGALRDCGYPVRVSEPTKSTSESDEVKRWTLDKAFAGARLDAALVAHLEGWSRSRLQGLVKAGAVSLDGEVVHKPGTPVSAGATVEVRMPQGPAAPTAAESRRALEILFEDDDLVVVNKPPGLLSHKTERGGENSLAELARAIYGELPSAQGEDRPGIVHRLDRETSGVIVLGRTEAALAALMAQFKQRKVRKTYETVVHGDLRFDSDWIEAPLGRDSRHPDRVAVVEEKDGGRPAATFYEVRERFGGFAYVHAFPKTGRTHQIRVHLASIGHPVVGDRVYRLPGGRGAKLPGGDPLPHRQMLHACRLELEHPTTGEALSFEAPSPKDLAQLLEVLRASVE